MIKKILKTVIVIIVVVYVFLLSAVGVFCNEPQGEPAWVEWEKISRWESERMKLGELAEVAQQPIVCMDGLNGKLIFKRYRKVSEKDRNYGLFNKYKDVDVLSVWSEIVADKPLGFTNMASPVLKCYLNHCALEEVRAKENEHD